MARTPGQGSRRRGIAHVGGWTGLVLLLGLAAIAVGPVGTLVLLLGGVLFLVIRRARKANPR